jgi:hypothetical protein
MDYLKKASTTFERGADYAFKNPYIMAFLKVTLVLYAAQIAPKLPAPLAAGFNNTIVKILALVLLIYISEKDFQLAVIMAVAYVIGMNMFAGRGPLESFANYSKEYKPHGKSNLIEPQTAIYPGCQQITMADLENVFKGDRQELIRNVNHAYRDLFAAFKTKLGKETLMKIAYAAGLPYNREFTDEHAPYIATILMYQGMHISKTCTPPN